MILSPKLFKQFRPFPASTEITPEVRCIVTTPATSADIEKSPPSPSHVPSDGKDMKVGAPSITSITLVPESEYLYMEL